MMLRVLLAEDHLIVRQGVKLFLESKGVQIVGEATNGREAVEMARDLLPDVVIMDIHMPELTGIEATRRIHHDSEAIRILILTAHDEPSYVHALLEAGADGFILKTAELSALYKALLDISAGGTAFSSEHIQQAVQFGENQAELIDALTDRELDVLRHAALGLTNKEIGRALFVSDRTVQGHLQNVYQKLHVATRTEAVTKALSLQLFTLNEGASE
jgi:DNA-binding NarL/FixJ family response regulator